MKSEEEQFFDMIAQKIKELGMDTFIAIQKPGTDYTMLLLNGNKKNIYNMFIEIGGQIPDFARTICAIAASMVISLNNKGCPHARELVMPFIHSDFLRTLDKAGVSVEEANTNLKKEEVSS